ncbi:hypothetical protein LEP1GSC170_1212 [Leptospira interrogans serovar Bataviae str. HAI135]|nr:hypothetical protein LEP1GSC170_1212 [Leptospira interrogans serovar Bataviae str. HAI135]
MKKIFLIAILIFILIFYLCFEKNSKILNPSLDIQKDTVMDSLS